MRVSNVATVLKQIKNRKLDSLYFITGEDEVEKAALVSQFTEVVEEGLRAFNVDRFYGGEVSVTDVIDAAGTFPLMTDRRVVLVFRAEQLLMPKRENEKTTRDMELLTEYLKSPQPHATVVFVASKLDKRRKVTSQLLDSAVSVECGSIEDAGDASRWLKARAALAGIEIEADAIRLLIERSNLDNGRLRSDTDRLLLYSTGHQKVTVEDAKDVVGPATASDAWAITRAIEKGALATALRELALALDGGAVPYMVLGQLGWVVRTKLPEVKVADAVQALFETDLDLKTSAGDPRILLERLVVELCSGKPSVRTRALRRRGYLG